jgi:lysophospholipase L1-like esterase
MSAPSRSTEDLERRRAVRRRQVRRRRAAALAVLVVLVGGGVAAALAVTGGSSEAAGSEQAPGTTAATSSSTSTGEAVAAAATPVPDGSLGARNVRLACTLLTKQEVKAQFGGPVGKPTPMWPYCQWTIGRDAWLALWVGPKTSIERMRERSYVLEDVGGLGDDAFFGTDRYLYFGQGGVSYYLVYQRVGEYTELRKEQLLALAATVLSRPLDTGELEPASATARELLTGAPTRERPLVVYFGGDSLSAGPEWAFFTQVGETKLVKTYPEYQVGTGIVRSDYFDWRRHLQGALNARRPDVAIFMSGANDSQDYIIDGVYHPNGSQVWRKRYRRDVSRIMDVLAADGRKVIWVGMPPMQEPDLNDGMAEVNRIVADEADEREGVSYVDTWALFSAPGGGYTPEVGGESVRLEDGIHLNVEGSELLAAAIAEELARITGAPDILGA